MPRVRLLLLAFAATLLTIARADAATILNAHLTHDQETAPGGTTPPTTSAGAPRPVAFGDAVFVLNDAQTQMSMSVTIFNIDVNGTQSPDTFDNLVAAHIHVGAPPGANAPVRWGFFGAPLNDTTPNQLVITPFTTGVGGIFTSIWDAPEGNAGTTLASNLPAILAGLSYINFHTVQFGGGEIRGQIVAPVPEVPEPSTMILLGTGVATALARRRRSAR